MLTSAKELDNYIYATQIWALILAVFGGVGNLTAILAVIHELYLDYNKKEKWRIINNQIRNPNGKCSHRILSHKFKTQASVITVSSVIFAMFNKDILNKSKNTITENCGRISTLKDASCLNQGSRNSFLNGRANTLYYKMFLLKWERDTIIILSLCITDFIYCVVNLPLTYYTYTFYFSKEEPSQNFCILTGYIRAVVAYAEWLTVGFLFFQRGINVKRFLRGKIFSPSQTLLCLAGLWIFSILTILPFYFLNWLTYDKRLFKCGVESYHKNMPSFEKIYVLSILTSIPCIFVFIGFGFVMVQILRNNRSLIKYGMSTRIIEQRKCDAQYSIIRLAGLVTLFFTFILPIVIYEIFLSIRKVMSFTKSSSINYNDVKISIIVYMIYWMQYVLNFVIYVVANPRFRTAYRNLYLNVKILLEQLYL